MTPPQAILSAFRNYANFEGRACRSEYWWFYLFFVVLLVAIFAASVAWEPALLSVWVAYLVAMAPALVSVTVRRLHDVDRSGRWAVSGFLPFAGGPRLTRLLLQPGTEGPNRYGPDPLRPQCWAGRVPRRDSGRASGPWPERGDGGSGWRCQARVPSLRLEGTARRRVLRRLRRCVVTGLACVPHRLPRGENPLARHPL